MRERNDSTAAASATPSVCGKSVAIFVPDDHPLLQLKRALKWEAITEVMVMVCLNLNKLMRDIGGKAKKANLATA